MFATSKHRLIASKTGARLAALGIASAAALSGVVGTAASASAQQLPSCSLAPGVEVWEYARYSGKCVMFQSDDSDTHGLTYSDGALVFWVAGSAENNYPWGSLLCYDSYGSGPCQGFSPGPYSANLSFEGVGSVFIYGP